MPFQDPEAKLFRALHHVDAFDHEVTRFLDSRPYGIVHEFNADDGWHVWRVKVHRTPPMYLGVIAGDAIHNLRTCLDHMAWQLALMATPSPNKLTEFPIFIDSKARPGHNGFDPNGRKKVTELPIQAQKIIESIQNFSPPLPAV